MNFKEFPSHFPLYFIIGKIPETSEERIQFLVKFEINEEKISHFTRLDNRALIINDIEELNCLNTLIDDKIKVIGISGKSQELRQDIRDILEKEKRFFEFRLKIYLNTNNREIIPYDYFEQRVDSDNNISEPTEKEKEISAKYYDEKRSKINTVEEAVNFLINEELNEENINEIKNKSLAEKFDQLGGFFGLGMYLRNIFIYPNKNEDFLQYLKIYDPQYIVDRGEFGEGIIDDLLWRKLNHYRITDESKKKIADLRKEQYDEDAFWSNYIKEQLFSYNLDDAMIRDYLEMENKMENNDEDFEHYYYEQKRILAGISDEEKSVYDQIKQDYFTIRNLIEQLKNKP
ncbi:hypothetical protein [Chryseobacterium sp. IT-36CA2]|uniref:hypothetical protein n=1 Tax=Chryseobacterium sp. IT-36CA2 TaxID=3026460 RepID=UPI0039E13837